MWSYFDGFWACIGIGKVKIVGDKSLRKLVSKHHRRWKEKFPSEKFPLNSNIFESNMLNSIKPGPIPGVSLYYLINLTIIICYL
jgi:hypothetical protein